MGLDITAYKGLTRLDCVFDAGGEPIDPGTREPIDDCIKVNVNSDFPERADDLSDGDVCSYADCMGFRAGSYGGYNQWRERLAELAGYPVAAFDMFKSGHVQMRHDAGAWETGSGPFYELIHFSDCEGVIGPATAAKLARDFADFQAKADAIEDNHWREKYTKWRQAFEMAAEHGAVDFH